MFINHYKIEVSDTFLCFKICLMIVPFFKEYFAVNLLFFDIKKRQIFLDFIFNKSKQPKYVTIMIYFFKFHQDKYN